MTKTDAVPDTPLPDFGPEAVVDLDLREELRAGSPPLSRILESAEGLRTGGVLHLRTPFQPRPLFALLGGKGFVHHSQPFAEDDWSSWFWREATPPERRPVDVESRVSSRESPDDPLDLRLLPPPEPLMVILERTATSSAAFEVLLPFDPAPLHGFLGAQGWKATTLEVGTDGVRMRIEKETGD